MYTLSAIQRLHDVTKAAHGKSTEPTDQFFQTGRLYSCNHIGELKRRGESDEALTARIVAEHAEALAKAAYVAPELPAEENALDQAWWRGVASGLDDIRKQAQD